jgi:hypothetical protein
MEWKRILKHFWWKAIFLKKLKMELPYESVIYRANTQKNVSQNTIKTFEHSCLLQYYSQWPSSGNSPDTEQLMNGLRKCGIYTTEYYLGHKEEWSYVICR